MPGNDTLIQHFGDDTELWSPSLDKKASPAEVLADKVILVYFTASWCPPCKRFSPMLIELYKKLKADDSVEDFEIVCGSLDKAEAEYKNYMNTMPWWCLPFESQITVKWASMYANGPLSIPLLVVLDKDGSIISPDAVGEVTMDQQGKNFPWRPKPIVDLLPSTFIANDKTTSRPMEELDDKYLMLYFSAHWCPPCKMFTPKLSSCYTELKKQRDDFEILFVSSDHDKSSFDEYFGSMSFAAIPYEEREAKAAISSRMRVQGIPTLMIFGPKPAGGGDRPLINNNIRGVFEGEDYIKDFPYEPRPYGDINRSADNINNFRSLVVFHEGGDDEEQGEIQEALIAASDKCEDKKVKFFWANTPIGLAKTLRDALKLGPPKDNPVMILLNIPDHGAFYMSKETDITTDSVLAFVNSPGEKRQL